LDVADPEPRKISVKLPDF
jgi:ABC-type multidrug transport system fused ATPase/permease subunit